MQCPTLGDLFPESATDSNTYLGGGVGWGWGLKHVFKKKESRLYFLFLLFLLPEDYRVENHQKGQEWKV